MLLGTDTLRENDTVVDITKNILKIGGKEVPIRAQDGVTLDRDSLPMKSGDGFGVWGWGWLLWVICCSGNLGDAGEMVLVAGGVFGDGGYEASGWCLESEMGLSSHGVKLEGDAIKRRRQSVANRVLSLRIVDVAHIFGLATRSIWPEDMSMSSLQPIQVNSNLS